MGQEREGWGASDLSGSLGGRRSSCARFHETLYVESHFSLNYVKYVPTLCKKKKTVPVSGTAM